eukprot:scaffold7578_cov31-Tisochrysis_lutea.AAC.2
MDWAVAPGRVRAVAMRGCVGGREILRACDGTGSGVACWEAGLALDMHLTPMYGEGTGGPTGALVTSKRADATAAPFLPSQLLVKIICASVMSAALAAAASEAAPHSHAAASSRACVHQIHSRLEGILDAEAKACLGLLLRGVIGEPMPTARLTWNVKASAS